MRCIALATVLSAAACTGGPELDTNFSGLVALEESTLVASDAPFHAAGQIVIARRDGDQWLEQALRAGATG